MDDFDKKYYRISQVSEMLDIPVSTLRFWETQFTIINPKRTNKGTRLYTPMDMEKIRMVYYLVKERGMKLEAAQEMIRHNKSGVSKKYFAIERLKHVRDQLEKLGASLGSFRK